LDLLGHTRADAQGVQRKTNRLKDNTPVDNSCDLPGKGPL